jgi:single-stranded-DNA-specific exonuclease
LALGYGYPPIADPQVWWSQLVGQAKYLARTRTAIAKCQWQAQWNLSETTAQLALTALSHLGFDCLQAAENLLFEQRGTPSPAMEKSYRMLINALQEAQFKQQFFCEVPLTVLQKLISPKESNPIDPALSF